MTDLSGFEKGKYDPADLSGECRAMWDGQNLYLAFDITDNDHCQPYAGDIVWLADAIEFGVDRWAWGVSLTQNGPEVFSYIGEGLSAETVNKDVQLAVRRDSGHTIYEVAIPARLNKPLVLEKRGEFPVPRPGGGPRQLRCPARAIAHARRRRSRRHQGCADGVTSIKRVLGAVEPQSTRSTARLCMHKRKQVGP